MKSAFRQIKFRAFRGRSTDRPCCGKFVDEHERAESTKTPNDTNLRCVSQIIMSDLLHEFYVPSWSLKFIVKCSSHLPCPRQMSKNTLTWNFGSTADHTTRIDWGCLILNNFFFRLGWSATPYAQDKCQKTPLCETLAAPRIIQLESIGGVLFWTIFFFYLSLARSKVKPEHKTNIFIKHSSTSSLCCILTVF